MNIKGFQSLSCNDFPEALASVVFLSGCNLRCPYCHNPSLISFDNEDAMDVEMVKEMISIRAPFIDGVVVSGGEATLHEGIEEFFTFIKSLGLKTKLDTNGLQPDTLRELIDKNLVDFVALDLKTSPARYDELGTNSNAQHLLSQSVDILKRSQIDYEIRTTCAPGIVRTTDIREMGELVKGVKKWVLQQFVPDHALSMSNRKPLPDSFLHELSRICRRFAFSVDIRGSIL